MPFDSIIWDLDDDPAEGRFAANSESRAVNIV